MEGNATTLNGPAFRESPAPDVAPLGREWIVAGLLSLLWVAGLTNYGIGYFWGTGRSVSLLEIAIFVATLLVPVMSMLAIAFVMTWSRRLDAQNADLIAAVNDLRKALELASPASTDAVVSSLTEAAKKAIKAEQGKIATQLKVLTDDNRRVGDAVRRIERVRNEEHDAIADLVQTARHATHEAVEKAEAADVARSATLSELAKAALASSDQDALPFDDAPDLPDKDAGTLVWPDITRALNFPSDEADKVAFDAIRRVLPNRTLARLLHKSEAVLELLAEEGIYMDDLESAPTNPEDWRAFAVGTRGKEISGLGAIKDMAAVALAKGRMRSDAEFRETSLEFLRQFDWFLQEFVDAAKTSDLIELGHTRTGRAFQLLARITGAFD